MASLLDIPTETSPLQTLAIAIILVFPALALFVVIVRDVGRLASKQFGLGERARQREEGRRGG
jgi:hypothetical protein